VLAKARRRETGDERPAVDPDRGRRHHDPVQRLLPSVPHGGQRLADGVDRTGRDVGGGQRLDEPSAIP
jgi:hypothetical protein